MGGLTLLFETNYHSLPLVRPPERQLLSASIPSVPQHPPLLAAPPPPALLTHFSAAASIFDENTFQFQVIFQSCSLAIIFASLLFISRFFLKPHSSTGVLPAVLNSKSTVNPSHLSNASCKSLSCLSLASSLPPYLFTLVATGPPQPSTHPGYHFINHVFITFFLLRLKTPPTPLRHASCTRALAPTRWLAASFSLSLKAKMNHFPAD